MEYPPKTSAFPTHRSLHERHCLEMRGKSDEEARTDDDD